VPLINLTAEHFAQIINQLKSKVTMLFIAHILTRVSTLQLNFCRKHTNE